MEFVQHALLVSRDATVFDRLTPRLLEGWRPLGEQDGQRTGGVDVLENDLENDNERNGEIMPMMPQTQNEKASDDQQQHGRDVEGSTGPTVSMTLPHNCDWSTKDGQDQQHRGIEEDEPKHQRRDGGQQ